MAKRVVMKEGYTASYPDPIDVRAGDGLITGKPDTEYPGWVWCTCVRDKKAGWMPEEYIAGLGERRYAFCDYSAKELTAKKGEELAFIKSVKGWMLCENENGEQGWVPEDRAGLVKNEKSKKVESLPLKKQGSM